MNQLDIFSIPVQVGSSSKLADLPKAEILLDPKVEIALEPLPELRQIADDFAQSKSALVEGCMVRSNLFFKGKTAKVLGFELHGSVTLAIVEVEIDKNLFKFPRGVSALEVVSCS
jgi:hypothetical protein